jgi:beta-lactamase class A
MKNPLLAVAFLLVLATSTTFGQTDPLRQKITLLLKDKQATVGVAVYGLESKDTLSIHNTIHYPMLSVFKFHLALAVLHEVDKGKLALNQKIPVKKKDLLPDTWSPIREKYPEGNIKLTLAEIIRYTVAESDNNGCDILLRLIGGPATVNDYIHNIGIRDVAIEVNEAEMHTTWDVQFRNWTTPRAAVDLLRLFYEGKTVSPKSQDFLWKVMLATSTGKDRIRGQIPPETPVAHKTGSSFTNEKGLSAATNDIGIITLPNGKHFAIAVFVSNSMESNETNERIIADITKAAWDFFYKK